MRRHAFALLAAAVLSACAPFPEIDAMGADTGPAPKLAPIDGLLAQADAPSPDPAPALQSRATSLKARAAAITLAPTAP
jgi:hypothetical protein